MYTKQQKESALRLYKQTESVSETVRMLGYPSRKHLYNWNYEAKQASQKKRRAQTVVSNTPDHPRNPSLEVKLDALHRCFELGESIKSVSEEIGYTRASIYAWRKKYLQGGAVSLMNDKNIQPGTLKEGTPHTPQNQEIEQLRAQLQDMQLEIDILKETINVLKKDPGIDLKALKNREKAVMVDALKDRYSLPILLKRLDLSKSSYYYQEMAIRCEDKYSGMRKRILELFYENKRRYGYRRIYGLLRREGIVLSEKIVRRIMQEERLQVKIKRWKKYSSYQGEVSAAVPNMIQRDFHADKPNRKWLTDITEFAIPAGKVYLSPIVDCFDGMLPCWTIGTTPDALLVNTMLDRAVAGLQEGEKPIIHSDRGCHYRWPGWIERMEKAGLERSMSRRGCSPDNSACEGLFGRIKKRNVL